MKGFSQKFSILCYVIAVGLGAILSSIVMFTVDSSSQTYIYLSFLLPQVCYIATVAVLSAIKKIPFRAFIGKEDVRLKDYGIALLIAFGIFFVALLPNAYIQKAFIASGSSSTVTVPTFDGVWSYILGTLVICVLPAIGEELVFRKVFCDGMKDVAEWKIILLGGLIFSFSHFNLVQTVHQFVLGCVLCLLYVRTKNITLTMLVHFINNFLALFIEQWTGTEIWQQLSTLIISCVVGALLLGGGIFCLLKFCPQKEKGKESPIKESFYLLAVLCLVWAICVSVAFL